MKTSDEVRSFTVEADDDGIRVDRWFKRHLPQVGFGTVSKWARTGQVRVDGKRVKPDDRLEQGQQIRVPPGGDAPHKKEKTKRELKPAEIEQAEGMVITRTKGALVLNKPPGLATQGGTNTFNHVDGLLDAYAPGEDEVRPRLVHRLDKDTSGVLLVARTPGSASFFSKRFSGRSAKKVYWALVIGVPDIREGVIEAPLAKQPGSGGEKMHVDHEDGQAAKTKYRVVDSAGKKAAWLELQPMTGRTHQLRVHCAAMGHPIVGDGKYGGKDAFLTGTISRKMHLHARRIRIDHPDGGQVDVRADLPPHMADSFADLGFDLEIGDALLLDEPKKSETPEAKRRAAAARAKDARKERKGERRSRGAAKTLVKPGRNKAPSKGRKK